MAGSKWAYISTWIGVFRDTHGLEVERHCCKQGLAPSRADNHSIAEWNYGVGLADFNL